MTIRGSMVAGEWNVYVAKQGRAALECEPTKTKMQAGFRFLQAYTVNF